MNNLDWMLERNKDFAAQQSAAGTLMPSLPQSLPSVKAHSPSEFYRKLAFPGHFRTWKPPKIAPGARDEPACSEPLPLIRGVQYDAVRN
jgi:hypothetical protein